MNKKNASCLLALTSVTLAVGAYSLISRSDLVFRGNANSQPYTLSLDEISHGSYWEGYYEGVWKPFLTATRNGNSVYLQASGYNTFDHYLYDGSSSFFTNLSPINGLQSITITSDYDVSISYGYSPNRFDVENVTLTSGSTYDFGNNYPTYFKVANTVDKVNNITSFSLIYSCEEHSSPFNDDYLVYEFNNATIEENKGYLVKNSSTKYDYLSGDVVIKDKYDDGVNGEYPVIGTYENVFHGLVTPYVRSVYFPDSITSYGNNLFDSNKNLKSVRLSPNAHTLSERMFYECNNLESINIPNGVNTIGAECFTECNSISTIVLPDSVTAINDGYFYGCFQGMDNLKNITWTAGMSKISDSCFRGTGLETVTIPDTVTEIGYYAFQSCPYLETVIIGKNVSRIDSYAFSDDISLETIDFSGNDSLLTIYSRAFSNCDSLSSIDLPDTLVTIDGFAFYDCDALVSVEIPDSVVGIGGSAFRSCDNLESVTFGSHVVTIGDYAFKDTALESVVIPGSATNLYFNAFESCTSLKEVTISEGVATIPSACFISCTSLETVNLPSTLTKLSSNAFANCIALVTVNFAGTTSGWSSVTQEDGWHANTLVTVVHCSDGDVTL